MTTRAWPLFDLRVTTPRLTLRLPREDELLRLAERAVGNVLAPEQAGFMRAWAQLESPQFEREFMQFHWRARAGWNPARWQLPLGVYADGELWGSMDGFATEFLRLRSVTTGSWLMPEARGQGLGKEMRAAIVQLCFAGLGACEVRSAAHPENAASLGVSRALGYREDGTEMMLSATGPVEARRMRLAREDWRPREDIEISGLDLTLFGL